LQQGVIFINRKAKNSGRKANFYTGKLKTPTGRIIYWQEWYKTSKGTNSFANFLHLFTITD